MLGKSSPVVDSPASPSEVSPKSVVPDVDGEGEEVGLDPPVDEEVEGGFPVVDVEMVVVGGLCVAPITIPVCPWIEYSWPGPYLFPEIKLLAQTLDNQVEDIKNELIK